MALPHVNLLGPRGYPELVKQQLLHRVIVAGQSPDEAAAAQLQASARSIRRWRQQAANGQDLQNQRPGPEKHSKFVLDVDSLQLLENYVQLYPDAYLDECFEALYAADSEVVQIYQVDRGLSFLGFTRQVNGPLVQECHIHCSPVASGI